MTIDEKSVCLFLEEAKRRFPMDRSARAAWLRDQRGEAAAEALYRLKNGVARPRLVGICCTEGESSIDVFYRGKIYNSADGTLDALYATGAISEGDVNVEDF